jgi:hypothetical protein
MGKVSYVLMGLNGLIMYPIHFQTRRILSLRSATLLLILVEEEDISAFYKRILMVFSF